MNTVQAASCTFIATILLCFFIGTLTPQAEPVSFTILQPVSEPTNFNTYIPSLNEQESEKSNMTDTNQSIIPDGWTTANTGMKYGIGGVSNVVHDTSVLHGSSTSIRIDPYTGDENTAREANSYYLPVKPGDVIRFSLYMKTSAAADGETERGARFGVDLYGASGRLTGAQTPDGGTWTPPNNWPANEDDQFVTWGSDWTLRTMEFTVADTYPADPWAAEAYEQGSYYVPVAIIPWLQVYSTVNGGQGWFADVEVIINPSVTVVASTELINYSNFTAGNIDTWISLLQEQGITEFTLRIPAYTDFTDGTLSSTYETVSLAIIADAYVAGIDVNIDLHTWYTTWDTYFEDAATNSSTYRSTYLSYITDCIGKLDVNGVKAFMVLNEPQAQTASTSENNFILSCISTAQAATAKPVSVRFMGGYSPSTGHYSAAIDTACDFICRNTYWDAQSPDTTVYGSTEAKILTALETAHNQSKELWITEFGKAKTNTETQRAYVEAFITYANAIVDSDGNPKDAFDKVFCWASQPSVSGETYNIFTGFTPYPAFYELGGNAVETQTATPLFNPVAGVYGATQNVTISCTTAGSTIYYTTDGSTPDAEDTEYTTPVEVAANLTLKALAVASGYTDSDVSSAVYTISPTPGNPIMPVMATLTSFRRR